MNKIVLLVLAAFALAAVNAYTANDVANFMTDILGVDLDKYGEYLSINQTCYLFQACVTNMNIFNSCLHKSFNMFIMCSMYVVPLSHTQ